MGVSVPVESVRETHPVRQFWVLAVLLVLVFLAGGSSRGDVQSLQFLRPLAILASVYAIFTAPLERWREYRHLAFLLAAALMLIVVHLIPLPPSTWHQLPGRRIIQAIDQMAGLNGLWRPLSMVPTGTWNALYSLSVPVAVFTLAVQLTLTDHVRLLALLVMLAIASGAVGLLQASGADIQAYALSSETAGLFANRNHQGVLLAMLFPMLAVLANTAETIGLGGRLSLLLASALAIIAVPLVIVTGSRAGLIASLLAVLMTPVIGLRTPDVRQRRQPWMVVAKGGLALVVIGALVWLTIFASRETALNRLETAEDDIRYPVWASIIDSMHVYWPWGAGVGSYADVYQIMEPDVLLRPTFSNHAHNEWLEVVFTAGMPGLILIGWAVILFFYAAWRALRARGVPGILSRLGVGLILLLAFASTLDYPIRTPIMASVLVIAAVWASSFNRFGIEDGRR